jgi:hypothetical protein
MLSETIALKNEELNKYQKSFSQQVIAHGQAQEEALKWRSAAQDKDRELAEMSQSRDLQQAWLQISENRKLLTKNKIIDESMFEKNALF